jgi:hypothetical protein
MPPLVRNSVASPAEPRGETRILVRLPGRYWLMNRRTPKGDRPQFACRAINVSPTSIALAAPVQGGVGERVLAEIEHLGKLHGVVERLLRDQGFLMRLSATDEERAGLLHKIDWLEKHKNLDVPDRRKQSRFGPDSPFSSVVLPDSMVVNVFVIDLSVDGAAVSSHIVPEIGTPLALGTLVARVVRHFPGGFAVKFLVPQDRDEVEHLAIARMDKLQELTRLKSTLQREKKNGDGSRA